MEMNGNERIIDKKLSEITGGMTEEKYYAEYEKYGPLDTEEHILQGGRCPECHKNTLRFWRYQPGPFGNKEAVYVCDECHEYQITVLRK